ncbi:hypothetical protein DV737_g2871, partial [Chaetothyriales sp. CBS 132003]
MSSPVGVLQAFVVEYIWAVLTPLNFTLLVLLLYAAYRLLTPRPITLHLPAAPPPVVFRTFNPRTLLPYNGMLSAANPSGNIYIGVKGKVFDVTPGRNFYGPGGPYENFAGRDATRGLACQSFDESMLTKDLDGPLDDCKDLDRDELENLKGWVERFTEKVNTTPSSR